MGNFDQYFSDLSLSRPYSVLPNLHFNCSFTKEFKKMTYETIC